MVSIYAMADVSGANFNPAVSLALAVSGKLHFSQCGIYIVVQLIAGILAGLSYYWLFGYSFNLMPGPGFGWWEAMIVEVLYTLMLCFVVLNVATVKATEGNQYFGLAIGFVIVAGGYAGGNVSCGCFNPAVAFGIDISSAGLGFGWCFAYLGYEMIGAGLASLLFRLVHPEEFGSVGPKPIVVKLIAEAIGTFFLVFTVGMNVLNGFVGAAFSIGSALMCMIYALGPVSGAHFNPAVTCAIFLSGRDQIRAGEAGPYVAVQLLSGIIAAFMYSLVHHGKSFPLGPQTDPDGESYGWFFAALAEIVFTFVLCFVVLCVATTPGSRTKDLFGLAIGSCVIAGGLAVGAVSGGSLNPAVSVAIATSNIMNEGTWVNCLAYSIFEFLGAALAAAAFFVTHHDEYMLYRAVKM
jgi:aquaporin Z